MVNRQLKAMIVDDEIHSITNLKEMLITNDTVCILDCETDPEKALEKIIIEKPDLLFLDIQMPNKNGFDIAANVFMNGLKPHIIFVTASDKYAIKAIRYSAFDYLLKPIKKHEIDAAISRLINTSHDHVKDDQYNTLIENTIRIPKIKINTTNGFIIIKPQDILYIKADWNYSDIYFDVKRSETVTLNLGKLEKILPLSDFFRISRSIIINTNYLDRVNRRKMEVVLEKESNKICLKIPILNLRKLEKYLTN